MKRRLFGYVIAGGIVLGMAASARAQVVVVDRNPYSNVAFTPASAGGAYAHGYAINGYGNPYYTPAPPASPYAGPAMSYGYGGGYAGLISPGSSWYTSSYAPAGPILSANWPYVAPGPSWYTKYSYGFDFGHWKYQSFP